MHAGVDDEAAGPPDFVDVASEEGVGIGVEAEFFAEAFSVEAPAFDVGGVAGVASEFGEAFEFHGESDLEVVAGDAFVEGKGFHFVLGACFGFVEVDGVGTGACAIGGGSHVVGGGGVGGDVWGNGVDAVGHAGHSAEEFDYGGVDAFVEFAIGGEKFFAGFVVETFVGAEEDEEFIKCAFELDLFDDVHHLGANAFDFVEADLVDLPGREVGGGEVACASFVEFLAVGEVEGTDFVLAGGEVFVLEKGEEFPVGWYDELRDDPTSDILKVFLIFRADGGVYFEKGLVEAAIGRVIDDLGFDLAWETLHDDLGVDHTDANAFAHEGDGLVHVCGEGLEAFDPILIILFVLEAKGVGGGPDVLDAPALIKGDEMPAVLIVLDLFGNGALVEIEVELVGFGESGSVECLEFGVEAEGVLVSFFYCREGDIGPEGVEAAITGAGGTERVPGHAVVPLAFEECV